MAWIVKNSAGTEIDRREEPYLSDAIKSTLESEVLPRFPNKRAALLPALHELQHHYNWLPAQALEEVAEFLELSAAEVMDTATFYEEFWLEPKGKYLIMVCQSLSCELLGHDKLVAKITEKLGIEPGQTTPDGKFTLMAAECLGSCGTAPVALVNETLHENLTAENLEKVLGGLA